MTGTDRAAPAVTPDPTETTDPACTTDPADPTCSTGPFGRLTWTLRELGSLLRHRQGRGRDAR